MLDELLDALSGLDVDELREAYAEGELDLWSLCDRTTPTGIVFRILCVICDHWDLEHLEHHHHSIE